MSHGYVAVNWNHRKIIYDLCVWLGIISYVALFIGVSNVFYQGAHGADAISTPIILLRALSTCAFLMLTIILCIGPLARIDRRFLPLLYNRRHFGVSLFIVALLHAAVAIYWYHSFGVLNPIISVFISGGEYQSISDVPFQVFGAAALAILFLMAATSHDYWNATLGGPLWKALHMLVYVAYALVVVHIVFGALQQDDTGLLPWMAGISVVLVGGLHLIAAFAKSAADLTLQPHSKTAVAGAEQAAADTHWVAIGEWQAIPNNRAVIISINDDERIAVFRYDETKLAAVSNVCQHQNGPLGEGRVIDGLITCPWHGYQYKPEDGCSPPPFTEKIKTYRLKVEAQQVFVDPSPLPPGAPRPITQIK